MRSTQRGDQLFHVRTLRPLLGVGPHRRAWRIARGLGGLDWRQVGRYSLGKAFELRS